MKTYELKKLHVYTDGKMFFEYIEPKKNGFIFAIVDYENGCMYHMNPCFYCFMTKSQIEKLKEYVK